jgi:hypothetical protein
MHYRVLGLAAWLLFFYNLERVRVYIGAQEIQLLTRFAYGFVAFAALVSLALPVLHRLPLWISALGGTLIFLVLKMWFGFPIWGEGLPVTVTEICAILITLLLTRQVILAIREFEVSIVNFTVRRVGRRTADFVTEQGEMYQEVRRARAYRRPLAMMAVEPEANSFSVATEKMVEEVQQATMRQYVLAALAKTLESLLGPYSCIGQDGERFLVLLPEASKDDLPRLTAQVRGKAKEAIGLDLRIGAATLPEIETFDGLVDAACAEMTAETQQQPAGASAKRLTSVQGQLTSQ